MSTKKKSATKNGTATTATAAKSTKSTKQKRVKTATAATTDVRRADQSPDDTSESISAATMSEGDGHSTSSPIVGYPATSDALPLAFNFERFGTNRGILRSFARRLGKSETMVSRVLTGDKLPPVMMLVKMAGILTDDLQQAGRLSKNERISVDQILTSGPILARIVEELEQSRA